MSVEGLLHGIRVVKLATHTAGPLSAPIPGDIGADLVKVVTTDADHNRLNSPTRGPKMVAMFQRVNRTKRSLVLDIKQPAGKEASPCLPKNADVLVNDRLKRTHKR